MLSDYGKVYENYNLINNNTYRVVSYAKYYIIVDKIVKLTRLVKYLNDNHIKYFVIGNGSNIILPSIYDGVVIKLKLDEITYEGNYVYVGASTSLAYLALDVIKHDLSGLEPLSGIPGVIGACSVINAGAFGTSISDFIEELEVLENNKIRILKKSDLKYTYRDSNIKRRYLIVVRCKLKLNDKNPSSLEVIKKIAKERCAKQDFKYPCAGSVFKNPEGLYAGKLIEDANLKGVNVGDAYVSSKHANFIVNKGSATGEDIIKLINLIQDKVKDKYKVDLGLEQIIIK